MRKEGDEYVIFTEGSDLKAILEEEGVYPVRTNTNSIHEVEEVLGEGSDHRGRGGGKER